MASASINDLLRRTALALAAAAASLFAVPALALTVTLNNTTGSSCTYTGITTDPSGNVQVNCQTTGGTGPGTFSVSMQASATVGTASVSATVSRNSGNTGQVIVTYNVAGTGTGCASPATGSTLTFADGSTGSQMIVVTLGANAGDTCTVTITGVDNSATIGTGSATVTLAAASGGGGGTPPPPAGCPATPTDPAYISATLVGIGQGQVIGYPASIGNVGFTLPSGKVAAIALPPTINGHSSAVFKMAPTSFSPSSGTLEISISKCPGTIDTNGSLASTFCYFRGNAASPGNRKWYGKPTTIITSTATAQYYSACWAGESEGQWYANIRYVYTTCNNYTGTCGQSVQWNDSTP